MTPSQEPSNHSSLSKPRATVAALLGVLLTGAWVEAAPPPPGMSRLLVKPKEEASRQVVGQTLAAEGAEEERVIPQIGVRIVRVPEARRDRVLNALKKNPNFEFAEVDEAVAPDFIPNDPGYGSQWHLPKIAAPAAWDYTAGNSGVVIAILDSGIHAGHPDLTGKIVPGWNFYDNNSDTSDVYGHGTKVAGAAVAAGNNSVGIAGVAWGASLMPIRVTDTAGYGYTSAITQGLTYAADRGVRVANISFSVSTSSAVASAAQYFQSRGGVVTISAGNSGTFNSAADNPYVLTVSATSSTDTLTSWSNTGNNVDLSAPGAGIYTTISGGGYSSASGTSFSAPIVAGVAALVIAANPALSGSQAQDIVKTGTDDLGTSGWDPQYGTGRVNAAKAVTLALAATTKSEPVVEPDVTAPTVTISSPASGAVLSGTVTVKVSGSDDREVVQLHLLINGVLAGESSGSSASFSWNTTTVNDGSYTLEARARDAAGNWGSVIRSVSVSNTTTTTTTTPGGSPGNAGGLQGRKK